MSVLSNRTTLDSDSMLLSQMEEMRLELAAVKRENDRLRLQLDSLKRRLEVTEVSGPVPAVMEITQENPDSSAHLSIQTVPSTSTGGSKNA